MDAEIEKINRMCDTVNKNLLSIGVCMNNSGSATSSEDHLNTNITSSTHSADSMSDISLGNSPQRTTASLNSETEILHRSEPSVVEIPVQIIDLSEIQSQTLLPLHDNNNNNGNDDDDVIIVSSNINPIVDLCTPVNQKEPSRRRRLTVEPSDLCRRHLTVPDVLIVDTSDVEAGHSRARRRRTEKKRNTLAISSINAENAKNDNAGSSVSDTVSGHTPYMCSVCMEVCLQRQPTSTRCGHIFCNECIRQAIQVTHKCPLCKTKLSRNHIFRIYP